MFAALLAAPAWAAKPGPCVQPGDHQEFPQLLAPAFTRDKTTDYESDSPGEGCGVRYSHAGGMWADVYVFSGGLGPLKAVERDPQLLERFQSDINGIAASWKQAYQAKLMDVNAQYEMRGRERKFEVMSVWAGIERPEKPPLRTHMLMWVAQGVIWKLRVTFPESDRQIDDPAVQAFGDALVDLSRETP
ncbi:hypothetical protein ACFJGW_01670 [Burkholderiaceae bacterium UC74_6]